MKVGINARLLGGAAHAPRGWNRYTCNLLAQLPAAGVEPFLYADRPIHPAYLERLPRDSYAVRVSPPMRYPIWEQAWLPRQCARDGVAVLHAPANFGLPWSSPCARVLTLHDAIDQVYYAPAKPLRDRLAPRAVLDGLRHLQARARAHRVIANARHGRGDLVTHLGIPESKVVVVPLAADPIFAAPVPGADRVRARALVGSGRPYAFYVGGWEGRKNVPFLVRGFAASGVDADLVLAGGRDDQRAALVELARSLGMADRLRLLGYVDDADLPALYAEAACFAYPSLYEGFGLQLCEAMAVGCPVLAAAASCLPEVLGDGGELFPPDDPATLAALLRRVFEDPGFRGRLADRARARSADFDWGLTARRTKEVYEAAVQCRH